MHYPQPPKMTFASPTKLPDKITHFLNNHSLFPSNKNKYVISPDYNYVFNYQTGSFIRWGSNLDHNPKFSPFGPEMLDLEVSTICHGVNQVPCKFCYKQNNPNGKNMSFETFKTILDKMPPNLTQIAFGIGDLSANPDLEAMFQYCHQNSRNRVIPNITINGNGFTREQAIFLRKYCGAVAVSNYNVDDCLRAIHLLAEVGMSQINIHQLLAEETIPLINQLHTALVSDPQLDDLNAIVFLGVKPKGGGHYYHPISQPDLSQILHTFRKFPIKIGSDSCSALAFYNLLQGDPSISNLITQIESCESGLFSAYINVEGQFYPCSFLEEEPLFPVGIDVTSCQNFLKDVWFHPTVMKFRKDLINIKSHHPFELCNCPQFSTP